MFDLSNKYYVITGGLGFLGRKFTETVCKYNGNPIIIDIKNNKDDKKFLKKLTSKYDNDILHFAIDITNEKEILKLSNKFSKNKLNIAGLVNNAAVNPVSSKLNNKDFYLENFSIDQLQKEFDIGIKGSVICTKIFGNLMAKNKFGSIVNISSDLGIIAPNHSIYNSSNKNYKNVKPVSYSIIKSGIIGLTKYTSTYWGKDNIRCNSIAPAGVFNKQNKKFVSKLEALIPMNRMLNIDELSGSLIFLLSNASTYVNGHTLIIDGGRTVW